jgi:hypothetical protein
MEAGAVSLSKPTGMKKFAHTLRTTLVDRSTSQGMSAVAKNLVKSPANIISTFSSVMFLVTAGNLLSKWNNFITEDWFGKTKQLFVPVVSAVAAFLPHIIIGLFADGVKPKVIDSFSKPLSDGDKDATIVSFIKSVKNRFEMLKDEDPECAAQYTFNKFMNTVIMTLSDEEPNSDSLGILKKYYLLERRLFPDGKPYLETTHLPNDMYSLIDETGNKVICGFRVSPVRENIAVTNIANQKFDIIFLAKYSGENNSTFKPVGRLTTSVSELLGSRDKSKWIDSHFSRMKLLIDVGKSTKVRPKHQRDTIPFPGQSTAQQ